ncbi:hypothetical protein PGTUg99_029135 [Puccinia graminis f. sp. tritici]|uniref:Uncharacterized protein n=1 Tax=Puccinia graminis f. sp. tritici TaxID=56615 RepID=A0A5B0S734_PUCGR|nr:hypothetical protein PGTUg99_029135 [Puccinia graminis f. sp. tritici]
MAASCSKNSEDSDGPTPDFSTRKMRELGLNAWKTVAVHGQIQDEEAQKKLSHPRSLLSSTDLEAPSTLSTSSLPSKNLLRTEAHKVKYSDTP